MCEFSVHILPEGPEHVQLSIVCELICFIFLQKLNIGEQITFMSDLYDLNLFYLKLRKIRELISMNIEGGLMIIAVNLKPVLAIPL
jgi:hypothetical protein